MTAWRSCAATLGAILACSFCIFTASVSTAETRQAYSGVSVVTLDELPPEARLTIKLIRHGGPFPYERDGAVFGNFERRLPRRERGYYREYTVPTPNLSRRGARRIVAGRAGELYYTDNHYGTFRQVRER